MRKGGNTVQQAVGDAPQGSCIADSNDGQSEVEVLEGRLADTVAVGSILHAIQFAALQPAMTERKEKTTLLGTMQEKLMVSQASLWLL